MHIVFQSSRLSFAVCVSRHNRTRPLTGPEIQIREKIATDALQMLAAGLIQGSSYCGIEANLLGSLRLQHTGGRLLAMARPSEVLELNH